MTGDEKPSGIKSVSVGFGQTSATPRQAIMQAPPYRVLIAGDFGLLEDAGSLRVSGRDLAELLGEVRPRVTVTVANILGSFPVTISETVELATLADLRPKALIKQFSHHREAVGALESGNGRFFGEAGQLYDKLDAKLPSQHPAPPARSAEIPKSGDDDLEGLFNLIATSSPRDTADESPEGKISSFISDNITSSSGAQKRVSAGGTVTALLDEQALDFLSDSRLRQVLENWHGLRLLLETSTRARGIEITIVQVAVDTDPETLRDRLAGDDGALQDDLFDILVFANRCSAMTNGADTLTALAEAADAFGAVVLATLEPDFARIPADRLAAIDAPQQALDGAGFEAFKGLRGRDDADRLGVFWNDVLAVEASSFSPDLFVPAALAAAAMVLRNVEQSGWPSLRVSTDDQLSGFSVSAKTLRGREIASATRAQATDECTAGLATIGIATLNGRIDRDSVHLARGPLFSAKGVAARETLNDHLVLARLNQLLQSVLPAVLNGGGSAEEKAEIVGARFDELAEAFAISLAFTVAATSDQDGEPVLDITVRLPQGVADRNRFEFQIPC
jgi:predicted component of type VI protein secretion system